MNEWSIKIDKVSNGFHVETISGSSPDDVEIEHHVFEEYDDELATMRALLLFVKEYFGMYYSKHNKINLVIEEEVYE